MEQMTARQPLLLILDNDNKKEKVDIYEQSKSNTI